jgi:hypothetical protein
VKLNVHQHPNVTTYQNKKMIKISLTGVYKTRKNGSAKTFNLILFK